MGFDKKRFIVTGATTDAHENATVLTDKAKAKLSKPTPVIKKAPAKKPVAKKAPAKKAPAKKAPAKKAPAKSKTPKVEKTVSTFKISDD